VHIQNYLGHGEKIAGPLAAAHYSLCQVSTKYPVLLFAAFCLRSRLSEKNKKKTRKRVRDLLSYRFLVVAAYCPLAHQSSVVRVAD
jgi:hypothetical protein